MRVRSMHRKHSRQGHAYRGVEKGAQAQTAREWVECEECCNCEHDQIKEEAEIPYRHAVDATVRTLGTVLHPSMCGGHQSNRPA